ncbi:MAG: hypothetical protein NT069_30995, partial [Planctomycetota bacterium]|nr:hypothetical protein [Planctomycetota bacterium]
PAWFVAIVERLLSKNPADRFTSAAEVSQLLGTCLCHVQQPASVPLPESLVPREPDRSKFRSIRKGILAMMGTLIIGLLGVALLQGTDPPDISGQWAGDDWGQVELIEKRSGEYEGSYTDTIGGQSGELRLKWSRIERRFNGTWREGDDRLGKISVRLVDTEIRGGWTTSKKAAVNPGTPKLADLLWKRSRDDDHSGSSLGVTRTPDATAKVPSLEQVREAFLREAGDSPAAVMLFDRIAADEHLIKVLSDSIQYPDQRRKLYASELWRTWRDAAVPNARRDGVPSLEAAVCFFLGCDPWTANPQKALPDPPDASEGFRMTESQILSTSVRIELSNQDHKEPFGRLMAGWAGARGDMWTRALALEQAREFQLDTFIPLVRHMAADATVEPRFRLPAITLFAELAGQDSLPLLRRLLDETTECYSRKLTIKGEEAPTAVAQICDIALGCLLVLAGKDLREAGFDEIDFLYKEPLTSREYFRLAPFGFFSEANRNSARKRLMAMLPSPNKTAMLTRQSETRIAPSRSRQFEGLVTGHNVKIAYSHDGQRIALAGSNPTLTLTDDGNSSPSEDWNPQVQIVDFDYAKSVLSLRLTTDDEDAVLAATENISHMETTALAFSPDGKQIAVGTNVGFVKLFDATSGALLRSFDDLAGIEQDDGTPPAWKPLKRAMGRVVSLAFSPDGKTLATCGLSFEDFSDRFDGVQRLGRRGGGRGRLKLWDVETGTLKHDLDRHTDVFAVAFSPDGNTLASAGRWQSSDEAFGNGVLIWNARSGTLIHSLFRTNANGGVHAVAFSPDGKMLAMGAMRFSSGGATERRTGGVSLVEVDSGTEELLLTVPGWAQPVAFADDGKTIAVLCGDQTLRFLDVQTGGVRREITPSEPVKDLNWNDFAISPARQTVAIGVVKPQLQGGVEVWDLRGQNTPAVPATPVPPKPTDAKPK